MLHGLKIKYVLQYAIDKHGRHMMINELNLGRINKREFIIHRCSRPLQEKNKCITEDLIPYLGR